MATSYTEWCAEHGCTHGHCPHDCEHPQPIPGPDGRLYCGRCWFVEGVVTEMVPCNPVTCED